MHISSTVLSVLALSASSLAGPVYSRSLLSSIKGDLQNLKNATIGGVVNTVKQSVSNPALTLARVEVVTGLKNTATALTAINATGNADVAPFVAQSSAGLKAAQGGVNNIGQALISNVAPSANDQKVVAEGIKSAQDAIQCMSTVAKGDANLTATIAQATTAVGGLRAGGESVLKASNKSFTALGLPADFDFGSAPDCSGSGSAAGNSTASAASADVSAAAGKLTSTDTSDASANSTSTDSTASGAAADSSAAAAVGNSTSADTSDASANSTSTASDALGDSSAADPSDASADPTADVSDASANSTSTDASAT